MFEMRLKSKIRFDDFLKRVRVCKGEVSYKTAGGDSLNLKSLLSEYVFLSAALSKATADIIYDGSVECDEESDYARLSDFLEVDG
jgi:hypothetical protein